MGRVGRVGRVGRPSFGCARGAEARNTNADAPVLVIREKRLVRAKVSGNGDALQEVSVKRAGRVFLPFGPFGPFGPVKRVGRPVTQTPTPRYW